MKQINQFSDNKIYFHTEQLKKVLNNQIVNPVVYELSLSGFCNCQCEYCCCKNYHSNSMLSKKDIDLLVAQLKDSARAVTITGGGEPLTNPNFAYCIKKLKDNGLSVGVITNGLLLEQNTVEAIVNYASFIRISLDTVDKEKYKSLRGIDLDIERLEKNLKLLSRIKDKLQTEILIGAQIVYIDQPIEDIKNTIIFAKNANIDFIQIRPLDNIPNMKLTRNYDFYIGHKKRLENLSRKYSSDYFKVILNENKFEEYYNGDVSKYYKQCLGANFTASIGHDMNLYFCCSHIGDPMFCIGNLRQNELKNLLSSEKRIGLIHNTDFQHCQIQCRNHKINKILQQLQNMDLIAQNEMIEEKCKGSLPQHYEFL